MFIILFCYLLSQTPNLGTWLPFPVYPSSSQLNPRTYHHGNLLINLPEANPSRWSYPAIIVYGGSDYATPEFMWQKTPEQLLQKAIIAYSPCRHLGGERAEQIQYQLEWFVRQRGLSLSSLSLCGFSSGGPDAMTSNPQRYKAIGLIDPVPVARHQVEYHSNMILSFRRLNWVNSEYYGKAVGYQPFEELIRQIRRAGGLVEEREVEHRNYVTYFFNTFGHKFL
jgi:hypothetical protein